MILSYNDCFQKLRNENNNALFGLLLFEMKTENIATKYPAYGLLRLLPRMELIISL